MLMLQVWGYALQGEKLTEVKRDLNVSASCILIENGSLSPHLCLDRIEVGEAVQRLESGVTERRDREGVKVLELCVRRVALR